MATTLSQSLSQEKTQEESRAHDVQWPREKWPGSQVPSHRWYGQPRCCSRRGPRVALERALHRLSVRYDADRRRAGVSESFSGSENARQELSSPPQSGLRLPLQPLQHEWRARQSERRSDSRHGWARAPATGSLRASARMGSTDFYTYSCGGLEDSAKIAKYSVEWYLSLPHRVAELVRKASTGTDRYLSFDLVTEHSARCASSSAATRARPACSTELASTCRPLPAPGARPVARSLPNGVAWPGAGQYRSRSGSPARPCLRALGWSDTPPTLTPSFRRRRG
jgi:hypothetical protein